MAELQSTIASAVVVPESTEQDPPTPFKRRQSSTSESGSKRARLSIGASHDGKDEHTSAAAPTDQRLERRKSGQVEERKRGQRLFGALIGTLAQSSSSTAQKRRADIEKKQQTKLRLQAEEYDEKKRKRFEDLMVIRQQEQKKFDNQSMQIRHSNLLATAHFLHTEAEPRLYYKPWELLPGEDAMIKSQIEEIEAMIERESAEFLERQRQEDDVDTTKNSADAGEAMDLRASETVGSQANVAELPDAPPDNPTTNHEPPLTSEAPPGPDPVSDVGKDTGDDNGEVVLEAEEDTVIY